MLVSTKWLKEYVNIEGIAAAELAEKITRSGIEVDAIIDRSQGMTNVVVGHVVECVKHPEADKLNICQVMSEKKRHKLFVVHQTLQKDKKYCCTSRRSTTRWH